MGRKVRPKAIDVTKSTLLQATATTLLVDLGDGVRSIQVTEEEISPTQGSEQAFSLRRKGVISESNKVCLCHQWRYGSCLQRAACPHIHIRSLFDVGDHLLSTLQSNGTHIVNTTVSSTTPTPPPPAPRTSSGVSPPTAWTSGPATASEIIKNATPAPAGTTWLEKLVPHKQQQSSQNTGPALGRGEDAASRLAGSLPANASWGKASSNNNSIALKSGGNNTTTDAASKTDPSSKTLSAHNTSNNTAHPIGGGIGSTNTNAKTNSTNGSAASAVSGNSTSSPYSSAAAAAAMKAAVPGMRAAAAAAAAGNSNNGNTQTSSVSAAAANQVKTSNTAMKSPSISPQHPSASQASNGRKKTSVEAELSSNLPAAHSNATSNTSAVSALPTDEIFAKQTEESGVVDSWEDLLLKQDVSNHPQQAFKSTKVGLPLFQAGSPVTPIDALLAGGAGVVDSLTPPTLATPPSAPIVAGTTGGLPDKQQLLMCLVGDDEEDTIDEPLSAADPRLPSMYQKPHHPIDPMAGMSNLFGAGVGPSIHGGGNSSPSFTSNGNPGNQSLDTDPYSSVAFAFGTTAAENHTGFFGGATNGLYGTAGGNAVTVPKFSTGVLSSVMPSAASLGGVPTRESNFGFMPGAPGHGVHLYDRRAPLGLRPLSPSMQELFARLTQEEE